MISPLPSAIRRILSALPFQIALFCLIWSSAFGVAKAALADCPPLIFLAVRFLLAGVVMLGAGVLFGGLRRVGWRDLGALLALGSINNALYLGFNYVGLHGVSAGLSALIISSNPVLTALLATAFLGERMSWRKAIGLLLGIGGVAFVVQSRIAGGGENSFDVVLVFGALLSLVAGTILFKRLAPRGGLWMGNAMQNLGGGLALAPFALGFESVHAVTLSWRMLAGLLYLALVCSVFGYLIWFRMVTVAGATAASAYHFLMPPLGILFGWLLVGEPIVPMDLAGIVPVALGIYLVTHPARPRPALVAQPAAEQEC